MSPGDFLTALSFLTRLGRPAVVPPERFAASVAWFPAVGLVVGLVCAAGPFLGVFGAYPALQGWLALCLSLWLTRGLHADGLADIADAYGSGASGDRFWEILKDSRAGPFGILALVLTLGGQGLAFAALCAQGRWGELVWCFVLGRLAGLVLLRLNRTRVRPGLGALFASGATVDALGWACACAAVAGALLCPWRTLAASLVLCALPVWRFTRLSRFQGGFNGDFIGAGIVLGELCAALSALLL